MKKQSDEQLLWAAEYQAGTAEQVLSGALAHFDAGKIAFASSLGAEDQVITHILRTHFRYIPIFTIDTGRLPQETYDLIQKTSNIYGFSYEVLFPDIEELKLLVEKYGVNLFYKSTEMRKACCHARKVTPLTRKLAGLKAWICGLRRSQAVTRAGIQAIEWDQGNGLVKVNPLVSWNEEKVWAYIEEHKVPYSTLHDKGYASIGCQPCTRAIKPGEDVRAGRWWWEAPEHKECGLHKRPRK